ncbi:MAG: GNAT family N-acetyltransferase [Dysgonamonadaceae bacterium]|jgi:predicted acetyltransferase|nr:GNAT family N-acetyltransferase [Dysgonamonadaceae bacterium]
MISFGKEKYIPALKELWKLCFPEDSNAFVNFYFNEVYKNDETLIYLENGKPAAALQMIPYSLKNGEDIFHAGYISGAMTHPDFQRRRFMRELLLFSFDIMRKRNFDYTFLIPQEKWLFDFYGKFGYKITEGSYKEDVHHCKTEIQNNPVDYHSISDTAAIYQIYHRFLSRIPQVVLKTEDQFKQILRDFFDEDGVLFADEQGIAFTFQEEDQIVIKEFFYQSHKVRDLFLEVICNYYSQEEVLIFSSFDDLTGIKGMIKRLDEEKPEISGLYISMMLEG